jgi:hypothetical protein
LPLRTTPTPTPPPLLLWHLRGIQDRKGEEGGKASNDKKNDDGNDNGNDKNNVDARTTKDGRMSTSYGWDRVWDILE